MSKMVIVIPTRGRVGKQITFSNLPPELRRRTAIVCPGKEVRSHEANHPQVGNVVAQPDDGWTIAKKRKWILDWATRAKHEKIVMMDDDLRFCVRRTDDVGKFRQATSEDVLGAFAELEKQLSPEIPHAGFSARGGGIGDAAKRGGWQRAKRMMYVLGYHVPTVLAETDPFRIETREDMDVSLQLLRKGLPNVVNYSFAVDQKFGAPGGASLERDFARSNEDAKRLAELHPGLVRVVEKDYSVSVKRLEVVVSWEKALREGEELRKSRAFRDEARTRRKGAR